MMVGPIKYRIPIRERTRFQRACKRLKKTQSEQVRDLIAKWCDEVNEPMPKTEVLPEDD